MEIQNILQLRKLAQPDQTRSKSVRGHSLTNFRIRALSCHNLQYYLCLVYLINFYANVQRNTTKRCSSLPSLPHTSSEQPCQTLEYREQKRTSDLIFCMQNQSIVMTTLLYVRACDKICHPAGSYTHPLIDKHMKLCTSTQIYLYYREIEYHEVTVKHASSLLIYGILVQATISYNFQNNWLSLLQPNSRPTYVEVCIADVLPTGLTKNAKFCVGRSMVVG